MPSGLIADHYGAPRHFSLPSLAAHNKTYVKPKLTVGHCDGLNLFYIRAPKERGDSYAPLALMR